MNTPLIVAHRGASGYAPENTFTAFDHAIGLGCPDIELDVRVTRDGVPVVFHDETLERTTNGTGPLAALPYAQLHTLDAGFWFSSDFAEQRVPTLEQVFAQYVGRARFTVEIKVPNAGLEAKVLGLMTRYGVRSSSSLCSFHPEVIAELEPVVGTMPVGLNVPALTSEAVVEALRLRASGLAAPFATLTAELVAEAQERGLQVGAWGIETEADARHAADWELDRIYCDWPDVVAGWLGVSPLPLGEG